jgi:hypothetical protein
MRLIVFLMPLLCACSATTVRCDAHLQSINSAGGFAESSRVGNPLNNVPEPALPQKAAFGRTP